MPDDFELTEDQKLANVMFDLYKGLDRAHGKYVITKTGKEGDKTQGRATTELKPYTASLWVEHLSGGNGLGVVPITDNGTCSWGAIDIDVYPLDIEALEEKVRSLGFPMIVLRTKSGGAHLTMFFDKPISCKKARGRLYEFALALGYGGVEIFPKQVSLASKNDVGNWLNMPYYNHRNTNRYAILRGKKLSIVQFIELARKVRITEEQLMDIEVKMSGEFDDGPPCLQMLIRDGKIPEGTRNNTLFAISVYLRKKYEDDWQDRVEQANNDFVDPPLKSREVQTIVKSAGRKEYFYPCGKSPIQEKCNKDLCRKRPYGIGEVEEEFTLNLGSLCKVDTDPPIWIIDVEGVRLQLDTDELLDQSKFRRACMSNINRLPPLMKRIPWERLIREKLETVAVIDAPKETRVDSRVNQYVQQYLRNTPTGDSRDELLLGRPWLDETKKRVYFRGNDLIRFLENNGIRLEARKIWNSLRNSGTGHGQISIGKTVIQAWFVGSDVVVDEPIPEPDLGKEAF